MRTIRSSSRTVVQQGGCHQPRRFPPASSDDRSTSQLFRISTIPIGYYSSSVEFRNLAKRRSMSSTRYSSSGVANSEEQKANRLALQDHFSENKRPDGEYPIHDTITNTLEIFSLASLPYPSPLLTRMKLLPTLKLFPITRPQILFLRHFPNNWKVAIVFPIKKPGKNSIKKPGKNSHSPDSYRPISLLSILSKIAEYILLNGLTTFTNNNNFFNRNPYGFTRHLSSYHPLLRLTEKISSGFQRVRSTGAVFLDIQKAFDRVWVKFTN
ncbi:RNA-directed DNA polymerase from mobile element jockey [Trichonephila clavipes]|uniref:RNA-directed DNA polymerase from mobile element jockey n=1 Tax=Trichonephila clavipes TaxID=2585209 RepID=A0A8X7BAN7_TRICX|nr:RNA-directed DNA polymerase from mobile element jockey [Trichonephila clavipes]